MTKRMKCFPGGKELETNYLFKWAMRFCKCIAYAQKPLIRAYVAGLEVYILHGSRGEGQGVRTSSLKNHKNIGVLSHTDPDPLKNHKATNQNSMLDHHQHASETPFKWRFAGGSPLLLCHPLINQKTLSELDPIFCFVCLI